MEFSIILTHKDTDTSTFIHLLVHSTHKTMFTISFGLFENSFWQMEHPEKPDEIVFIIAKYLIVMCCAQNTHARTHKVNRFRVKVV